MRKDPKFSEPRLPAIAIWTISGLLLGAAFSVVAGSFPLPSLICGLIGLAYGLYTTRPRQTPSDD